MDQIFVLVYKEMDAMSSLTVFPLCVKKVRHGSIWQRASMFFDRTYEEISWATTFFAAEWQKWDFLSSRKTPIWTLTNTTFATFKNLDLIDLVFEVSKSQKIILKGLKILPIWRTT